VVRREEGLAQPAIGVDEKKEGRLATYLVRIYLFMALIFDVFLAFSFAIQWNPQYFPSLTSLEPQEGLEQAAIGVDEKEGNSNCGSLLIWCATSIYDIAFLIFFLLRM
jgi:hypothetical protein